MTYLVIQRGLLSVHSCTDPLAHEDSIKSLIRDGGSGTNYCIDNIQSTCMPAMIISHVLLVVGPPT